MRPLSFIKDRIFETEGSRKTGNEHPAKTTLLLHPLTLP